MRKLIERPLWAVVITLLLGLPAQAQTVIDTQLVTANSSGGACAVSQSCASFQVGAVPSITLQVSGTFVGTLTFEGTSNGTNWLTVTVTKLVDASAVTTTTGVGQFSVSNTGLLQFRARATAWTSGTATVTATRGLSLARSGAGGGGGSGTVTSIDLSVPAFLAVTGNPVTSSGTLAIGLSGTALPVANGGTGLTVGTSGGVLAYTASGTLASSGALTANLPVIGGGAGVAPTVGTVQGNTTKFTTYAGSAPTTNDCAKFDANGNITTAAAACGAAGAPADATYITQTANGTLSAEQALSALASGIVRVATTTGVLTSLGDVLPVANGGTGIASGTSGGILGYTASGVIGTSIALTANMPVIGAGPGGTPTVGTVQGNTTKFTTYAGSAPATNDCAKFDANGNVTTSGAACGGSGSSPGGSDTYVQFNDSSSFGGDAGFVYNKTTDRAALVGGLGVGTPAIASAKVDINLNAGTLVAAPVTAAMRLTGAAGGANYFLMQGWGGQNNLALSRVNGTIASPTGLVADDLIGSVSFYGNDTADPWAGPGGIIQGLSSETWSATAHGTRLIFNVTPNGTTANLAAMTIANSGRVGIGVAAASITADLHLQAGTTAASTAPLKFTSGSLLTTAEAGAVEFLTDKFYGTITTGGARKTFAFLESPVFVTPNLGTPSAGVLTNATGLPEGGLSLTDITTANASTSAHGFVKKLDNVNTNCFSGQGNWVACSGGSGSPGGSNTQVQFNDSSAFGGDAGFVYNKTTDSATLVGTLGASGFLPAYITKTANYTAAAADSTIECLTNAFTITLPTASGITGRVYTIKNSQTANACTIDPTGSETVDGTSTVAVTNGALEVQSDGTNWRSISSAGVPITAIAQGDLLYGSAASTLSSLAKDTNATRYLANTGTSNNPAWAQINVANGITGTVPVANGGTGLTAGTSGGVLAYTASGTLASSGALTANLPVIGGGAGAVPTVGTRSGNTTAYVTTTGTQTSGDCVKIDANGNHIANGSACGSGGSGTVTATGGSLTSNAVVLGAGTTDTKVVAGITTNGTAQLVLGVNTTTLGSVKMFGNTSGDVTLSPNAVAGTATALTLPATSDTLSGKATVDVLTNKTLDAEGTGNVITLPMLYNFTPAVCQNATPSIGLDLPSTLGATATCQTGAAGGHAAFGTAKFVNTEVDEVQGHFKLPADWTGAIDLSLDWLAVSATGNDVVWQVKFGCAAFNETMSGISYNTTAFAAVTNQTTTLLLNVSTKTGITTTGCAANETASFIIFRDTGAAGDTLDQDIQLVGIRFTVRRAI